MSFGQLRPVRTQYARILATGNRDTFSEGDGTFVLGDLPPGLYQVRLDPASIPASFVSIPVTQTLVVKSGESATALGFQVVRPVVARSAPPISRGVIAGTIWEIDRDARSPANGVILQLDQGRTATSGLDGTFRFTDVPAGNHRVRIVPDRLAAEYDLESNTEAAVTVTPGKVTAIDYNVVIVALLTGKVIGPPNFPLAGILVRLSGTQLQTTTDETGAFHFPKLRSGDYTVVLEDKTLPLKTVLTTPNNVSLSLRAGQDAPIIEFHFAIRK